MCSPDARADCGAACAQVHSAMGHMYRTQSDEPIARRLAESQSMQGLHLEPGYPSAPDLRNKEEHPSHGAVLPVVSLAYALGWRFDQ